MRVPLRLLVQILICGFFAVAAPAAQAAFGVEETNFEAGTCTEPSCTYASGPFYTQAAGHPPFGITTFEINHHTAGLAQAPDGVLRRLRVDVPPGLAANPEALEKCPVAEFEEGKCAATHPGSHVGTNKLVAYLPSLGIDTLETEAPVFNLEQPRGTALTGLPLDFGIEVAALKEHIFLQGHVSWSTDYHEYFEITVPPEGEVSGLKVPVQVLKSKLIFEGTKGGNFLTLPSVCSSSTTSFLEVEDSEGHIAHTQTHTPVGVGGCDKVPFTPSAELKPETAQYDGPDGVTTEVRAPQHAGAGEINTADIKDARLTLPEGLTLNPAAARGLATCTAATIGIGTTNPVECPKASELGTVTIETDLPAKSLAGYLYLGSPSGATITGPPFTVYLDAESEYGVSVRLQGLVTPNPSSGRLEVNFLGNPQLPFSDLILALKGGNQAPLANPLACGTSMLDSLFTPYTGLAAAVSSTPFTTDRNGKGGACPSPLPFVPAQSTQHSSTRAGAYTSYTFNLERKEGDQHLAGVSAVLPPGLVGAIPSVTLCGEPAAQAGSCGAGSLIGSASVTAGAGAEPEAFSGPVYLTGPYGGAPYGLSIPVEAAAGPFDLGRLVTRAAIGVDPYSARVIATSALPTIFKGVPLRLRSISVLVNRPRFLFNPSNCGRLDTTTTLTSTLGARDVVASLFQVASCGALAFKPTFSASSSTRTSRAAGAGLRVTVTQGPHEANIRSVVVALPAQLPSRLTTLQKACPEATYAANPRNCPIGAMVGTATVSTPVLPSALSGPAYLVSHGGAAFPDLDLLLEGNGVKVILVGNTKIKNGITTSTFASIPDVPVSSFALDLPTGPHSALAAHGNFCSRPLIMPTTITSQSGVVITQNTRIAVDGCGVRILRRRLVHNALLLTIQTPAAGRVSASGRNLRTTRKRLRRAATTTLRIPLARPAVRALAHHRRVKLTVRVTFVPAARSEPRSSAATTLIARR
jgi:hypothetical protein